MLDQSIAAIGCPLSAFGRAALNVREEAQSWPWLPRSPIGHVPVPPRSARRDPLHLAEGPRWRKKPCGVHAATISNLGIVPIPQILLRCSHRGKDVGVLPSRSAQSRQVPPTRTSPPEPAFEHFGSIIIRFRVDGEFDKSNLRIRSSSPTISLFRTIASLS